MDQPLDVRLIPMKTVTGRVLNGVSGTPLSSAKVLLTGDTISAVAVRTDEKGNFACTALLPGGHYSIGMNVPGFAPFNDQRADFIAGTEDQDVGVFELRPLPNVP
jgi:hypothetical protein